MTNTPLTPNPVADSQGRETVAKPSVDLSPEAPKYLIRKHGSWYRPNERGYTTTAILAGRYTLAQAEKITHPNGPDGPRDGMTFAHEDDVVEEAWLAYRALLARVAELESEVRITLSCNRGLVRLNEAIEARAKAAEARLQAAEQLAAEADTAANKIIGWGHALRHDGKINNDQLEMFSEAFQSIRAALAAWKAQNA
jgi:hypothetical protein